LTAKELLTIKTGELLAKTDELREVNESLHLLNNEIRKKSEEVRNTKKDLTETEMKLLVANDNLIETNEKFSLTNKELAKVNKDLVVANEQIKQLVLKQKEFMDITGHELRTPVQALSGNFELIEIDIPSLLQNSLEVKDNLNKEFESLIKDKPRLEQFANRLISIHRNSQRLEKLVNDVLEASRIESNRLDLHKEFFNLNEKIQNVIKDIRNKTNLSSHYGNSYTSFNIVFEPQEDPIMVSADKIRIFEVLSNVINNAIKFSNGEPITISAKNFQKNEIAAMISNHNNKLVDSENTRENEDEKVVVVSVRDRGTGIDSDILPRLFTKFATKSDQGTGLGLYIAKSIIGAHGGIIWAENNKDGKGATFYFTLPLTK